MNKPILVKDNTEWTRLAPVLEKQGYVFIGGRLPTQTKDFALKPTVLWFSEIGGNRVWWEFAEDTVTATYRTQTVDEYLASVVDQKVNEMPSYNDWQAKYAALEKGVNEAIAEMEAKAEKLQSFGCTQYEYDLGNGYENAAEILKEKTK